MEIRISVCSGVEGPCVSIDAIDSKKEAYTGKRVGGPKPWGGGRTTHSWLVDPDDLRSAIDEAESTTKRLAG